ncbi:MAG: DUF4230 domain-containing protein [Selenomonadaceae bacterium]|nr:DUF4230 domain-containing protein [Selenomonadaceae bacterium]
MAQSFGSTLAICVVLIAMTGLAVYLFMRRKKDAESTAMTFQQMQTIVSEEIRNVRELVTVRKNFTSVISFNDDKKIPFFNVHMPGTDRKFLMNYSGTITCGCDLDKIRFSKDEMSNRVKIIVPNSQILDMYADVSSFKIHHQDAGILAENIKIEEQNEFVSADLEVQKQHALQEGILNRANENVQQMLTAIIARRGINQNFDVEIVFANQSDLKALNAPHD